MKRLADYQQKAANLAIRFLLSAILHPCGSGKSWIIQFLAARGAKAGRKQLIITSRKSNGLPFLDTSGTWMVSHNRKSKFWYQLFPETYFADGEPEVMDRLTAWIKSPPKKGEMIAVATQSAFSAWLVSQANKTLFSNLAKIDLFIDEFHHAVNVTDGLTPDPEDRKEEVERAKAANVLSQGLIELLALHPKIRLCVLTATWGRGDWQVILSETLTKKFKFDRRNWDAHLKWCKIKTILFQNIEFTDDPISSVVNNVILQRQEGHKHQLIRVPPKGIRWRATDSQIDFLCSELEKKKLSVLNLVPVETQQERIAELRAHPKKYDVVVFCKVIEEGLDWPVASFLHDTWLSASYTLHIQTLGRILRKVAGKTQVGWAGYMTELSFASLQELKDALDLKLLTTLFQALAADLFHPMLPSMIGIKKGIEIPDLNTLVFQKPGLNQAFPIVTGKFVTNPKQDPRLLFKREAKKMGIELSELESEVLSAQLLVNLGATTVEQQKIMDDVNRQTQPSDGKHIPLVRTRLLQLSGEPIKLSLDEVSQGLRNKLMSKQPGVRWTPNFWASNITRRELAQIKKLTEKKQRDVFLLNQSYMTRDLPNLIQNMQKTGLPPSASDPLNGIFELTKDICFGKQKVQWQEKVFAVVGQSDPKVHRWFLPTSIIGCLGILQKKRPSAKDKKFLKQCFGKQTHKRDRFLKKFFVQSTWLADRLYGNTWAVNFLNALRREPTGFGTRKPVLSSDISGVQVYK